jgi:hypothetical protein
LRKKQQEEALQKKKLPWHQRVKQRTGIDPLLCKKCGNAIMVLIGDIEPVLSRRIVPCGIGT